MSSARLILSLGLSVVLITACNVDPTSDPFGTLDGGNVSVSASAGQASDTTNGGASMSTSIGDGSGEVDSADEAPAVDTTAADTAGTSATTGTPSTTGAPTSTSSDTSETSSTTEPVDPTTSTTTGPACMTADDCPAGQDCIMGQCMIPGVYGPCLDDNGDTDTELCINPDSTCLNNDSTLPTVTVCSVTQCANVSECPAAPATGNATVACEPITGDPNSTYCYLDCSGNTDCPTDMVCFAGFACLWPGPGAAGIPYGDCLHNPVSICGLGGLCISNDPIAPTQAVCATPCDAIIDCPPAPPGVTSPVACREVSGDFDNECVLDCSNGGNCPEGMNCFNSSFCVWN